MRRPTQIASFVQRLPASRKSGTLRIWGQWFGRPMDNVHTCVSCAAKDDRVILNFDQGETLTIWAPIDVSVREAALCFDVASKIRWEWFSLEGDQDQKNLMFLEYEVKEGKIMRSSNTEYVSDQAASLNESAVQLYGA
jgi:hypothetical protein